MNIKVTKQEFFDFILATDDNVAINMDQAKSGYANCGCLMIQYAEKVLGMQAVVASYSNMHGQKAGSHVTARFDGFDIEPFLGEGITTFADAKRIVNRLTSHP